MTHAAYVQARPLTVYINTPFALLSGESEAAPFLGANCPASVRVLLVYCSRLNTLRNRQRDELPAAAEGCSV